MKEFLIKKMILPLLLAFLPVFSYSQVTPLEQLAPYGARIDLIVPVPAGYEKVSAPASKTGELLGEELFLSLHENSAIKTPHGYTEAKKQMFSVVDNVVCPDGAKGVMAFYSRICVTGSSADGAYYKEKGDLNGDGFVDSDGMNVEHLWPQSFFGEELPMKSDLHHLRPTFMKPNNARGVAPFTEVYENITYQTDSGAKLGAGGFEPPDEVKGDTARALLYFLMRYYDRQIRQGGLDYKYFLISQVETLMKWNDSDPPDNTESRRNTAVERYQGNRNPFIDDYTLVDKIGAKVFKSH